MVRDRNGDGLTVAPLLHHDVTALPPHLLEPAVFQNAPDFCA